MNYRRKLGYLEELKVRADSRGSQRLAEQHSKTVRDFLDELGAEVDDIFPMIEALRMDKDYDQARNLLDEYDLE